jgi:hypothetical protein
MVAQEVYQQRVLLENGERKINDNINVDVSVKEIDRIRLGYGMLWTMLSIRTRTLQRKQSFG